MSKSNQALLEMREAFEKEWDKLMPAQQNNWSSITAWHFYQAAQSPIQPIAQMGDGEIKDVVLDALLTYRSGSVMGDFERADTITRAILAYINSKKGVTDDQA